MTDPAAILVVEPDPHALTEIREQLAQRYAPDYRIAAATDREEALRLLTSLRDDAVEVALVLAGVTSCGDVDDLLERAHRLHPHAKRALVVGSPAWSNPSTVEAVRTSMALGRIDHFVLQPEASPDEVFHEAVSSFLLEWARERRRMPQTVHIVGDAWSGRAFELRETFESCAVPHTFSLADSDEGRELVAKAGSDARLPLMLLPDGRVLSDPTDAEIADAAGAPSHLEEQAFDVVIVGAGPAGLSAAVYGASERVETLVLDSGGIGGQVRSSSLIRNYLGFAKGVSGARLAAQAYEQASLFGASFLFMHTATGLSRCGEQLGISLSDGREIRTRALVLATGASYRRLGIEPLEALSGAGVYYGGPVSEAPALKGKEVYVVGGGNSAGQAVMHLARYARRVVLVVRAPSLAAGMSHYLVRMIEATANVDVRTGTEIVGGGGDGHLERLVLRDRALSEERTVAADALFVLIGARPKTAWLPEAIARDPYGFLLTGDDVRDGGWPLERNPLPFETSLPGVFAAGDVRRASVKRVAAAVGEGSVAAQQVQQFLALDPGVVQAVARAA